MAVLTQGLLQQGLSLGERGRLCPRRRPPPSGGGGKALPPGIELISIDAQFLGDGLSGLAAGQPMIERFTSERVIEFTARFGRCLVHGLASSLFAQFPVRQFEATSQEGRRKSGGTAGDFHGEEADVVGEVLGAV